jgi:hypothetical protein
MPRTLTATLIGAKNQVTSTSPFIWVFEVNSSHFPIPLRLAGDVVPVTFQGEEFLPFPVDISAVSENAIGEKQTAQGLVANVDRQVISLLNTYWDAVADPLWTVKIWQVYRDDPDQVALTDADEYEVMSATTDLLTVQFELEAVTLPTRARSTGRRFTKSGGFSAIPRVGRLF